MIDVKKQNRENDRTPQKPEKWFFSSFFASLLFHGVLFLLLFFLISRFPREGSELGVRNAESVGIVLSSGGGGQSGATPAKGPLEEENLNDKINPELQDYLESQLSSPLTLGQHRSSEKDSGSNRSSSGSDSLQPGSGSGTSSGSGTGEGNGGQQVQFSDLAGNGRKFVYVLDRSESMRWANAWPMKYALDEAKKSIRSLDPKLGAVRFQLIYYNHEARSFEDARLLPVNEANKNRVIRFLGSIYPDGGTNPLGAIELAVRLSPDVIFFLTDADEEIPPVTRARIHDQCRRAGIRQLHVIEFCKTTAKEKDSFRQLAVENNGQYIRKTFD